MPTKIRHPKNDGCKTEAKILLIFQSLPENYRKQKTNKEKYGFNSFFDEF